MGTDTETTLEEIKQLISGFVEERDWLQYHDPKNLVMALMSEVGELADQFRWVNNLESHSLAASREHAEEVADELALRLGRERKRGEDGAPMPALTTTDFSIIFNISKFSHFTRF